MEILFNEKGAPLLLSSTSAFMSTTGSPSGITPEEKRNLSRL